MNVPRTAKEPVLPGRPPENRRPCPSGRGRPPDAQRSPAAAAEPVRKSDRCPRGTLRPGEKAPVSSPGRSAGRTPSPERVRPVLHRLELCLPRSRFCWRAQLGEAPLGSPQPRAGASPGAGTRRGRLMVVRTCSCSMTVPFCATSPGSTSRPRRVPCRAGRTPRTSPPRTDFFTSSIARTRSYGRPCARRGSRRPPRPLGGPEELPRSRP